MHGFINRLIGGLLAIAGITLISMVGLSVWNVISRYVFDDALLWADEIATFAMIALAFLGAIACAWQGRDIRMDIILNMVPARAQHGLRIIQQITIIGITGWVAWLSWGYVARILAVGMLSTGARVPMWMVHGTLTLGYAMFSLIAFARLVRLITDGSEDLAISSRTEEVPEK